MRADCGGRLFTAKLGVVVHNLAHQLLNHLLTDDTILLARQFCDCLRDRICFRGIDFPKSLSMLGGGGRNYSRADETVARSAEAHAAALSDGCNGLKDSIAQAPFQPCEPSYP